MTDAPAPVHRVLFCHLCHAPLAIERTCAGASTIDIGGMTLDLAHGECKACGAPFHFRTREGMKAVQAIDRP